jgi:hypothetical protein
MQGKGKGPLPLHSIPKTNNKTKVVYTEDWTHPTPAVQHSQETDVCAEMFGVGGDLEQGLGSGVEQQVVEDLLVDQRQMREMMRHREDDVDIRDR